jgi:hypothetical protein
VLFYSLVSWLNSDLVPGVIPCHMDMSGVVSVSSPICVGDPGQ